MRTRLTEFFGIEHPIVQAPMDPCAGGELAAAVSHAGALGMIGGGYGNAAFLEAEYRKAGNAPIGCGFITWSMAEQPELLDFALSRKPKAMMLAFSDPAPFAQKILDAGVPLICQIHSLEHARRALDVGASVLVAQGTEAGGHSATTQTTLTFVPAVADFLARENSSALLLAAGGIADGRGLAAALMLGADGALMGTRFWATQEALIHPDAKARALTLDGDQTVRTAVYDVVRDKRWPAGYDSRLMRNAFIDQWHGREAELAADRPAQLARYKAAFETADLDVANVIVGEAIGLIHDLPPAAEVVRRTMAQAEALLGAGPR